MGSHRARNSAVAAETQVDRDYATRWMAVAGSVAGIGAYEIDFERRRMVLSEGLSKLLGEPADGCREASIDAFLDLVHEDDRRRVIADLITFRARGGCYEHEFRLKQRGGRVLTVLDRGKIMGTEQALATLAVTATGILVDVSERRATEAALRVSERRYRSLVALSSDWYWSQDANYRYTDISESVSELANSPPQSHIGKTRWELPTVGVDEATWAAHRALLDRREPFRDFQYRRTDADGDVIWLSVSGEPVFDETGQFVGYQGVGKNITASKRDAEAVRESEEKFRTVFDRSPDAIVLLDPTDWTVLDVNPAALQVHRCAEQDLVGGSYLRWLARDLRFRLGATLEELRDGVRDCLETSIYRADGSRLPVEIRADRMPFGGSDVQLLMIRDVAARAARDRQVQLLTGEVNHRAKNLLAVVQAIATQTAAETAPDAFARQLGERLRGLAASQDLIIRGEWNAVALRDLVGSQLAHLPQAVIDRIEITGDDLVCRPSAAQTIGMALHELATNALKYGALSKRRGRVAIEWAQFSDQRGDRVRLSWCESGGPRVSPPTREGFGQAVIRDMAGYSLTADVTLDYSSSGLRWIVDAPAEQVLANPEGARQAQWASV